MCFQLARTEERERSAGPTFATQMLTSFFYKICGPRAIGLLSVAPAVLLLCLHPRQEPCIDNFLPGEVLPCKSFDRSAIYELDREGRAYGNIYDLRKVSAEDIDPVRTVEKSCPTHAARLPLAQSPTFDILHSHIWNIREFSLVLIFRAQSPTPTAPATTNLCYVFVLAQAKIRDFNAVKTWVPYYEKVLYEDMLAGNGLRDWIRMLDTR